MGTIAPTAPWLHSAHGVVPRQVRRCYTCDAPFDHRWPWPATGFKYVVAVTPDGATRAVVYQCSDCFQPQTHPSLLGREEYANAVCHAGTNLDDNEGGAHAHT